MASKIPHALRSTTGLTGLLHVENARQVLIGVYQATLGALTKIPAEAAYRTHTHAFTSARLAIAEKASTADEIEAQIGQGQIEELIQQAQAELNLVGKIQEWKAWEPLTEQPLKGQWKWP
eukprot:m.92720 g.92720  ORF g.92720 m.92720 type:complete len:120 (-) comp51169_c0_seq1:110-469(-)